MYELPHEDQRQIRRDLAAEFRRGGLAAANNLVEEYALEEQMIKVYHKEFIRMDKDRENINDICNIASRRELLTFFLEIAEDHEHAMGRHAYALTTLFDLKSL